MSRGTLRALSWSALAAVLLVGLGAGSAGATVTAPDVVWTQQSRTTSPSARYGAAMAYDPSNGTMVLFGGYRGSELSDTWTWDGSTWTQQSPATSPGGRYGASLAFDAATEHLVLFGGKNGNDVYSDTWIWDGSTWTASVVRA